MATITVRNIDDGRRIVHEVVERRRNRDPNLTVEDDRRSIVFPPRPQALL